MLAAHRRKNDTNLNFFALNIEDVAMRALSISIEMKRYARRSDAQVFDLKCPQKWRQMRIDDGQLTSDAEPMILLGIEDVTER